MDAMIPFLQAIAEDPADDVARLVFSDWLDDHGQHERAEFIRLQIQLARTDPATEGYAEQTARMRRCGVFTRKGEHPFFDHLPTEKCKIAFRRGFIESIDTADADEVDASGFDLVPLRALRTGDRLIDQFKRFTKLKWLEYGEGRDTRPARLLELLGPRGWFKELETLSLPFLNAACLQAGVIPQFDLPELRNFFLCTASFYDLGVFVENTDQDDEYGESRSWSGLPDWMPKNAIPNKKSPLERFVWHADDDSDSYRGDRFWAGPTMESLLTHLKPHELKQVEVAVDWDDHESGGEGVDAAAYQQNPLTLCPTLEHVTLDNDGLRLLESSTRRLKTLRVYAAHYLDDNLFTLLAQPVCSELESLHVEVRGWWNDESKDGPGINFSNLKHLNGLMAGFANCQFPGLVSLRGVGNLKPILERKWPRLQCLDIRHGRDCVSDLIAFARSDCCPNLTTLTIDGYFDTAGTDLSFLADCRHMPFLSLIQVPGYPRTRAWIVDNGELVPVRGDVMLDEQKPSTVYRISEVF